INSTGGAIDPREWSTIAGNTDANGDASRDADAWIVTNPAPNGSLYTRGTALREIEYDNAGAITLLSEGALIPAGTEIDLGNIWIQSPYEDLTVNLAPVLRLPARPTPEDPIPPYPAPD